MKLNYKTNNPKVSMFLFGSILVFEWAVKKVSTNERISTLLTPPNAPPQLARECINTWEFPTFLWCGGA